MVDTPSNPRDSSGSATIDLEAATHKEDLPIRPWRRYRTSFDALLSEEWEGEGTEEKPYLVGWITNDPENPQTWTNVYKWSVTVVVSVTTMIVALASSTYSGAVPDLYAIFPGYGRTVYILGLSVFVVGFALGPLLWAPMSEVWGRRRLFIISYTFFTAFNAGLCGSQNIWTVIILRFFSGAFGSSPLTNAGGTISDIFDAKRRGVAIAIFASAPFTGPALGPIISGFLGDAAGFRWVFGLVAIVTAFLTALGALLIPETYAPVLLRQRAQRLSAATGKVYRSAFEKDKKLEIPELFKTAITRPWKLLFREPIVVLLTIYMSIIYGTLYMLFAAFPIVYQQARGWTTGIEGLTFIGVLVGFISGVLFYIFVENPRYIKVAEKHGGFAPPEARLRPAMLGGCLLPIGLFWFAWTAHPVSIHWVVSIIATVPFGVGMVLVFLSISSYLVDAYLIYAASVLAANAVLRSLFGAAFPLFTAQMYDRLGVNWASTLVAFLSLACTPMPFLFYRYGARIRQSCKYAAEAAGVAEMMKQRAAKQKELEKHSHEQEQQQSAADVEKMP